MQKKNGPGILEDQVFSLLRKKKESALSEWEVEKEETTGPKGAV